MKRILYPMLAALCLMLSGCAADSQATEPSPSVPPTTSPSAAPAQTVAPMSTDPIGSPSNLPETILDGAADAASAGVTSVTDAKRFIDQVEDELEKLSEVDDAQVIIVGDQAVVAIEPDDQYQGGVDERLRDMVRERIDGVVSGVKRVAVTDDPAIYEALEALGDSLDGAVNLDDLRTQLEELMGRIEA